MADQLAAELAKTQVSDDRIVSFEGKSLKLDNANSAADIVAAIEQCSNLEVFCLAGNTLGVEAAQEIAKALRNRPTLKYALWKDMYTGRLRSEIPPSLRSLSDAMMSAGTQLVELDLSDNAFGPDGAEAIRSLLTSPVAYTIQTLKFHNNGLGGGGVIIADCLKENHANAQKAGKSLDLRSFIAGRNRLENPGAKALGEAFSMIGTMEQIEIVQNGIQYEGFVGLASCIRHNPNLKILNLNDNIMTPRGAIAIAKEVVLNFNEIRTEGGVAVAESCTALSSLARLHLDGNHFGKDGKEEVQKALGSRIAILTGLNEDEGIPSEDEDDKEEAEEEEKKDVSEKTESKSTFVFGQSSTTPQLGNSLLGTNDTNRNFGDFGNTSSPFSFSALSTGTNIFATGESNNNNTFTFKGTGTTLFAPQSSNDNPEHEPDVYYEPLVTLQKVTETKTGHEEEVEMYKHRAKLFRMDKDAGMWKERGVGDIKILTNPATGRSRLVMRRDVILKLCCNHVILKEMRMEPNGGSDKSLVWFTPQDYSEEEPKAETLAVRFKTGEICSEFLAAFEKARLAVPEPDAAPNATSNAKPTVAQPEKSESFSFAGLAASSQKAAFALSQTSPKKPTDDDTYRDEYEPNVDFKPIVELEKVQVDAGTENEDVKFECRCKLYRFDKDQWKERGLGNIQVLWSKSTGKGRVLMRREQVLKICCNHWITSEMALDVKSGNEKFLTWNTLADFADEESKPEILAARFKTAEQASGFKSAFEKCQANLGKVTEEDEVDNKVAEASSAIEKLATEPASAPAQTKSVFPLLQSAKDKWHCDTCYTPNDKSVAACLACQTPNPDAPKESKPTSTFSFGLQSATPATVPSTKNANSFDFGSSNSVSSTFNFGTVASTPQTGFSFGTSVVASPPKEESKPSPFAGFSFGGNPTATPIKTPTFSFGGVKVDTVDYKAFAKDPQESTLEKILKPEVVVEEVDRSSPASVAAFLGKLSTVMNNKTEITCQKLTDGVLKLSFSSTNYSPGDVMNELLVVMGLIKSEDKDFKPNADVGNLLRLLSHSISQDYFPDPTARIIAAFIRKDEDKIMSKVNDCSNLLNSFKI